MNYFFDRVLKTASNRCCRVMSVTTFVVSLIACQDAVAAIFFTPFGANGEGGIANGQVLSFGSGGEVFELDAFVNIAGFDLNGATAGTSAQLSANSLPAGVSLGFATALSLDQSGLTLSYTLTNNSGVTFPSVWFGFFVDAQIDVAINDYFNEAADHFGILGSGPGDLLPDEWEADEPGYVFGDIFGNLLSGTLDVSNAVSAPSPDDVSLALAFQLGGIADGQAVRVEVLLSDQGNTLNDFAIQQFDTDLESFDALTISGAAAVPEPSGLLLGLIACGTFAMLVRFRCSPRRAKANLQE